MPKRILIPLIFCSAALRLVAQPTDIPGAQPGKCYAKCFIPDKYETVTEQIMLKPPSSDSTVVPAQIETAMDQYVSKEATTRFVVEPALFETVAEQIQVAPSGWRVDPAAYDSVQETVLIKPATKYFETTEPQFAVVQEPVEIEPAYLELEVLPQQYESVLERIEVKPAGTKWVRKKSDRDCLGADPEDCFVWCLVEVPAQYQEIYKKVSRGCGGSDSQDCVRMTPVAAKTTPMPVQKVQTPAKATELVSPAVYQTVTKWVLKPTAKAPAATGAAVFVTLNKQVLKKPAQLREEPVPAEYKPIKRKILKAPARFMVEPLPAEYITVTKRQLVRKGGFSEWREILCGEKITGFTIHQIQDALRALGYFKGASTGALDTPTKAAIQQFQKERDLPADGNVDFETLKALGIGY